MNSIQIIALIIFIITYIGIIFTRLPWINIDRPSAAFFGAVAMMLFGVISFDEAIMAIDFNTIALLLGMMLIIGSLQLDGFFNLISDKTLVLAKTPLSFLWITVFTAGFGSAFMVNDVIVFMITPIIINICSRNKLNPIPYLIAEILAANVGSVMTLTGNPQNMLIGIKSGIDYTTFLLHLMPISIIGLIFIVYVIKWIYPNDFSVLKKLTYSNHSKTYEIKNMKFSLPIFLLVIILFFVGKFFELSIPLIALVGGSLILLSGKSRPSEIIKGVDWVLLLFFASLFIVVFSIDKIGLLNYLKELNILSNDIKGIGFVHSSALIMSQIISNVPYTIAMLPLINESSGAIIWLSLASASTLAGNATIIGAMVNLIVLEIARKQNIEIKFMEFFKAGIITTIFTFVISIILLYLQLQLS